MENIKVNMKTLDALLKRVDKHRLDFIEFQGIKIQKSNHNYSDINMNTNSPKSEVLTNEDQQKAMDVVLFGEDFAEFLQK